MREVVSQTPGTIGYTDASTAVRNRLPAVHLRTSGGDYVAPSLRSLTAVGRQPLEPNDLSLPTISAPVPRAYPIASEQYLLTLRDLCTAGRSDAEQAAVKRLLLYLLGEGQSVARDLSLAPLPPHLRARARQAVRAMHCGDGTV